MPGKEGAGAGCARARERSGMQRRPAGWGVGPDGPGAVRVDSFSKDRITSD